VLIDSESIWDRVRQAYVESAGGAWREDSQRVMMGMSTQEWSAYLTRELGVPGSAPEVAAGVIPGVASAGWRSRTSWPAGRAISLTSAGGGEVPAAGASCR
jgi:hypothetical protein